MTTRKKLDFKKDDDYGTPKYIWEMMSKFIDKDKILYEPFFLDGKAKIYLNEIGYKNVIHNQEDFYENYDKYDFDMILTNPPYSNKKKVLSILYKINKPFIIIVPISTINKLFMREIFKNDLEKIQIIIPPKRMQFEKNGICNNRCWFDCVFLCYKMDLEKDITFI